MSQESEFDIRQLEMMMESIRQFESGNKILHALIADLEGLLSCLERKPELWVLEFQRQWSILEDTYSIALMKGQWVTNEFFSFILRCFGMTKSDLRHNKRILRAIAALKSLVTSRLVPPSKNDTTDESNGAKK